MTSETSANLLTEAQVRALVDRFYSKIRQHPELGRIFRLALHDNWDAHLQKMYSFWNTLLLDAGSFRGNVYGTHMKLEGIQPEHFFEWLRLFDETANDLFLPHVADEIMLIASRIANSLQLGFFGEIHAQLPPRRHTTPDRHLG